MKVLPKIFKRNISISEHLEKIRQRGIRGRCSHINLCLPAPPILSHFLIPSKGKVAVSLEAALVDVQGSRTTFTNLL